MLPLLMNFMKTKSLDTLHGSDVTSHCDGDGDDDDAPVSSFDHSHAISFDPFITSTSTSTSSMGTHTSDQWTSLCFVVLGDRTARRGIEIFERALLKILHAGHVTLLHVSTSTAMSEYVFSL